MINSHYPGCFGNRDKEGVRLELPALLLYAGFYNQSPKCVFLVGWKKFQEPLEFPKPLGIRFGKISERFYLGILGIPSVNSKNSKISKISAWNSKISQNSAWNSKVSNWKYWKSLGILERFLEFWGSTKFAFSRKNNVNIL